MPCIKYIKPELIFGSFLQTIIALRTKTKNVNDNLPHKITVDFICMLNNLIDFTKVSVKLRFCKVLHLQDNEIELVAWIEVTNS